MTKMLLTEDNDMIQAISADRADEPFEIGRSLMPMATRRRMQAPHCEGKSSRLATVAVFSLP
jgi:hypothetical protein